MEAIEAIEAIEKRHNLRVKPGVADIADHGLQKQWGHHTTNFLSYAMLRIRAQKRGLLCGLKNAKGQAQL